MAIGTTENQPAGSSSTGSSSSGQSGANLPAVESGTASAALIAAAEASSSDATGTAGITAGDTSATAGGGSTGAISGATGQLGQTGQAGTTQPASGQAPDNRIEAAVRNARAEARREVEEQFAPFRGMNPEDVRTALSLLHDLQNDPQAFMSELGQRLKGPGGDDEAYPAADLVSKDGTLKTYSEGTLQKALEVHGRKLTAQLMKEFRPFMQFAQTEQGRRQKEQADYAHAESVNSHLTEMRKEPHFTKENEPGILAVLQRLTPEQKLAFGHSPTERATRALDWAYRTFLRETVFPGIDAAAEKRVRESFNRKANASDGTIVPSGQSSDGSKPALRNQDDLARHMERMVAAATQ